MKRFIALFPNLIIGLCLYAQQTFSLDEAINYALAANNQIKLAKIDVADAEGQLLEYKSIGIPKVNASVDYNYFPQVPQFLIPRQFIDPDAPDGSFALLPAGTEQGMVAKIEASAIIFDAAWIVGLKAQRLYRELVARQGQASEENVKAAVTKAYLAILIAEKNKEVLEKNISNLEKTLKETRAIFENGFAEKLDVDRLQLSFNNLTIEKEKLDRLITISYNLLKFQMGYPMSDEISISDDLDMLIAKFTAEAVELDAPIDFNSRSEYSAINLGEDLAKSNIRRYRMGYIPVINAFGSHQQ
ncbi:MAG TPA: TolC family protein, partial [Saprospiraceae bacterium]|nr:TolC family protein [Saprospiraceae bacterium]